MKQKEAVYKTVCECIGQERTEKDEALTLTAEQKTTIRGILFQGFRDEQIELKEEKKPKLSDDKWLSAYVSGLLNNWMRKDNRFNGGVKYVARNPGSRAGAGDAVLKELRKLAKIHANDDVKMKEINKHIEKRKEEIAADKNSKIEVDMSKIPAGLRNLVS